MHQAGRSPWRNWIGDRLTAICSGCGQDAASRQASRSTHSPIGRMRPLSSAIGMNVAGRDHAAGRVMPAHQRLEADDLAADPGLRLIVEHELAVRNGRAQLLLERAPLAQALVHVGLEEADRAAPFRLGAIERGIGVADERVSVGAVGRIDRDADAHSDAQQRAVDVEIVRDRGQQPLGQRRGAGGLHPVGLDQHELVAAEAGEERVSHHGLQAMRERAQELVADDVAEDVVDLLEAVEVDAEKREACAGLRRLSRASPPGAP